MTYLKRKPRKLADGAVRSYWYKCEAYRDEKGRPREKVLEYLGTNPNVRNFPLEPPLARKVAAVVAEPGSPTDMRAKLKDLGLDIPFLPKRLDLLNTPPLRRLALRVE